ncbi:zinc finger protein 287-like [Octopus sinensis]|uniref:Zinc finger protein 287-like n=1 Tax=Octopus sinensis TaxID=2607531 RepID=A0A6P7S7E5_9MOLL|nr:zinc finger protein 287-like [Octopus sinensis]
MTLLNQLDIYIPFEFIRKCVESSHEGRPVLWSGSINDIVASDKTSDHLLSHPMSSEPKEDDSNIDIMQTAKVQTAKGSENMLQMSFSEIQLQVMEGRCGFCLSNVTQNKTASSLQICPSSNLNKQLDSEPYIVKLSKLSPTSTVTSLINYVASLNDSGNSCDLNNGAGITETPPVNSLDSENSEDLQKLVTLNQSSEQEETEKADHSDASLSKISSQDLQASSLSPLKTSSKVLHNEEINESSSFYELPQQVSQSTFLNCSVSETNAEVLHNVRTTADDLKKNLVSTETEVCDSFIEAQNLVVKPHKKRGRKPKQMPNKAECNQNKSECDPKEAHLVTRQSKRIMLRGAKHLANQGKKGSNVVASEIPKSKVIDVSSNIMQPLESTAVENITTSGKSTEHIQADDVTGSNLSTTAAIYDKLELISSKQKNDTGSGKMHKPGRRKRNNVRVVQCRYCQKMFCDYTGVDEHVKKFHADESDFSEYVTELKKLKVVKCSKCDATLQNRYLLQDHEDRVHFQVDSQICSQCGKSYKNLKSLRNHVHSVHYVKGKSNLCHLCPAKFKWAATLKQHIQEIHEGIRQFSCPTCKKEFYRKSQLNRHKRIHGSDISKMIVCKQCNKSFWFENNYIRHMRILHQPQKELFHCSYCGKGFSQKASMVAHVQLLHFNLYTFTCKICNMGFTRSKTLRAHMTQVHNDTDFVVTNSQRNRFKYNRTAEDLLYCTYCKTGFYYKAKLVEHIHQEHLSYFPHRCNKCKQGFLEKKFLENHLKKAHNIDESINSEMDTSNEQPAEDIPEELPKDDINSSEECCEELLPAAEGSNYDVPTAPLLVEVSNVDNTIHYLIQHTDQEHDSENNQQVIENIASLLLVAEQASNKESLPMVNMQNQTEFFQQLQYNDTFQN